MTKAPSKVIGKRAVHLCCACHGEKAYVEKAGLRCGYCVASGRQSTDAPPPAPPTPKPKAAAKKSAVEEWADRRRNLPAAKRWPTLKFGGETVREFRIVTSNDNR